MGKNACLRKWEATADQVNMGIKETVDRSTVRVENGARRCLTPHGFMNKEGQLLTWWKCAKRPS
jgi:hypothetical protein